MDRKSLARHHSVGFSVSCCGSGHFGQKLQPETALWLRRKEPREHGPRRKRCHPRARCPRPPGAGGQTIAARNQSLYSKTAGYFFSNDKGGIERAILLLHLSENQQAVLLTGNRAKPIGAIGENPAEAWGWLYHGRMTKAREGRFSPAKTPMA